MDCPALLYSGPAAEVSNYGCGAAGPKYIVILYHVRMKQIPTHVPFIIIIDPSNKTEPLFRRLLLNWVVKVIGGGGHSSNAS